MSLCEFFRSRLVITIFNLGLKFMNKQKFSILFLLGISTAFSTHAETQVTPPGSNQIRYSQYPTHKVLLLGANTGFVAAKLSTNLPSGPENDFDILVVGDADKINAAQFAKIQNALNAGKEVVFDAASDGSDRQTHAELVKKLTGASVATAAVRIQKVKEGGFMITPIEDEQTVAKKAYQERFASKPSGAQSPLNSADNVFGINNGRAK